MTIADYYRQQLGWRSWQVILDALPPLDGRTVLDLGCGVGDLAAALGARGALGAWRFRLDGMSLLRQHCGTEFEQVREEFLRCLSDPSHRSEAKVYCCIAARPQGPPRARGETTS